MWDNGDNLIEAVAKVQKTIVVIHSPGGLFNIYFNFITCGFMWTEINFWNLYMYII